MMANIFMHTSSKGTGKMSERSILSGKLIWIFWMPTTNWIWAIRPWKIYTEDVTALPQYIGPDADITRAFITQGCMVDGEVKNSVLFTGARVNPGAKVIDSVLMPGVEVEEGAVITRALVADGVKIGKDAVVGSADSEHIELVSKRVKGVE